MRQALAAALVLLVAPSAARGPEVNVSRAPGSQSEVSIAVDPSDPRVLAAGSNSVPGPTMRAYGSTDGGATWVSSSDPPLPSRAASACAAGDPALAIDRSGRQYYAFLAVRPCGAEGKVGLFVATRAGPEDEWRTPPVPVSPPSPRAPRTAFLVDDRPFLAADTSPVSSHSGRIYVAWSRLQGDHVRSITVSHSDDGGETWSKPARVSDRDGLVFYAGAAVARDGTVYVSWIDADELRIAADRSVDGGETFGPDRTVAGYRAYSLTCRFGGAPIPAQPTRCGSAAPVVSVDSSAGPRSGRVYVTYADAGRGGRVEVLVAALDPRLRHLRRAPVRVGPSAGSGGADRFLPVSAVDSADGRLWVCFYDTAGDPARVRARFSCTVSASGGRTWSRVVRAASAPSDATAPGARRSFGYGDYAGLAVLGGVAHPIWTDTRDLRRLREEIYTTRLRLADLAAPVRVPQRP